MTEKIPKSRTGATRFNAEDPFQSFAAQNIGLLPPSPIVRVEGWQEYVNKAAVFKPVMPTVDVFEAMMPQAKKEFAKQRTKYHAEMPAVATPTLTTIHNAAIRLSSLNYTAAPGARMGVVLDGLGTVGKSTIAMELGKRYELSWRKHIQPKLMGVQSHRFIPVIYVTLPGNLTIKDFNRLITSFMNISTPASASVSWLSGRIIDATKGCCTSMIIIDDIHYLHMKNQESMAVNNHLKYLASCISATFIYAGINVEGSGLLREGKSKEKAFASQTQHRFKIYPISPFAKESAELKPLLSTFEARLALVRQPIGSLEQLSDYIHDRTGGFMGSISNLIREGANLAIQRGEERLSRSILEAVRLDFASEAHRQTTTSRKVSQK